MKETRIILTDYVILDTTDKSGSISKACSVMTDVKLSNRACKEMEFRVLGKMDDGTWLITDPITSVHANKLSYRITTGTDAEAVTYLICKPNKSYTEFVVAKAAGIPVLNAPFMIGINEKKKEAYIKLAYPERADDDSKKFEYRKVVAQCGNFVSFSDGTWGLINWLCLVRTREPLYKWEFCGEAELLAICKENKRYVTPTGYKADYFPIKPYTYVGDEIGFYLPCPQYESMTEATGELKM